MMCKPFCQKLRSRMELGHIMLDSRVDFGTVAAVVNAKTSTILVLLTVNEPNLRVWLSKQPLFAFFRCTFKVCSFAAFKRHLSQQDDSNREKHRAALTNTTQLWNVEWTLIGKSALLALYVAWRMVFWCSATYYVSMRRETSEWSLIDEFFVQLMHPYECIFAWLLTGRRSLFAIELNFMTLYNALGSKLAPDSLCVTYLVADAVSSSEDKLLRKFCFPLCEASLARFLMSQKNNDECPVNKVR